jgi:hypothetical protein
MRTYILIAGLLAGSLAYGQESQPVQYSELDAEFFVPIEPEDKHPAVFPTQEELDAKIADKIDKIKQLIYENRNNPALVEGFRKDLWRFEHAIVKASNTVKP